MLKINYCLIFFNEIHRNVISFKIFQVLAKALIRFKQTELCLEFCSNKIVLGFLSGFKNWLGSQEQYGIYFTKIILLAYTVPDPSLVARIIKVLNGFWFRIDWTEMSLDQTNYPDLIATCNSQFLNLNECCGLTPTRHLGTENDNF